MVVKHEADRADYIFVLVLDRHPGDDQLLAAELHDIQKYRLARLRHAAHQAVGYDFLDRAAKSFRGVTKTKRGKIFFIDVNNPSCAIDRNGAFTKILQPLKERFHGTRPNDFGVADDGLAIGHGVRIALD